MTKISLFYYIFFWATVATAFLIFHCGFVIASKNVFTIEKFLCTRNPESKLAFLKCEVRMISRKHMRIQIEGNFTEPVFSIWSHTIFYYKYSANVYRKFPIDLWEDMCAWFNGSKSNYFLEPTWGVLIARNMTNFNHKCPYDGYSYIKADNITLNSFVFEQLIPSGRYRVDAWAVDGGKDGQWMAKQQFYFSISDTRIEQF